MDNYSYYPGRVGVRGGVGLLPKVATLFVFSCLATGAGAYVGRDLPFLNPIVAFLVIIGSLLVLQVVRKVEPLNVIVLYAFTFLVGLIIAPEINYYLSHAGGAQILGEAMVISAAIFSAAAAYGWLTSANLQPMRRYLIGGLFAVIALGLLSFFFLHSAGIALVYNFIIVALFVGFTAIDFQRIKANYPADEYVMATVTIYLDMLNIFLAVLNILGMGSGGRR